MNSDDYLPLINISGKDTYFKRKRFLKVNLQMILVLILSTIYCLKENNYKHMQIPTHESW